MTREKFIKKWLGNKDYTYDDNTKGLMRDDLDKLIEYSNPNIPVDIKYINVPNICFSLTDIDDEREEKFSKQRIERGFDDSETWSLTDTICRFVLPRLQTFKNCNNGVPIEVKEKEWDKILDKMILAFSLICRDGGSRIWTKKESKQIDEGMKLFQEWFISLWW